MVGVIVAITVLTTASIVPYATAGMPLIKFINFDRNGMQVQDGDCGKLDRIVYLTRGKVIIKLNDGSNMGTEFKAPGGTNTVGIHYDEDINTIIKLQFIRTTTLLGEINLGLGGATSVDINASKINGIANACGGDAPRGTTSATVFRGF